MKIALYDDNFKKIVERIRDILNLTELYLYIDSIFKGTSNEWLKDILKVRFKFKTTKSE